MNVEKSSILFNGKTNRDIPLFDLIHKYLKISGSTINPTALARELLTKALKQEINSLRDNAIPSVAIIKNTGLDGDCQTKSTNKGDNSEVAA